VTAVSLCKRDPSRKISSEDVIVFGFLSSVPLWTYVFLPLLNSRQEGHTMSADNWTDVVTAGGAVVAAGAAVYTAYLAKQAADTWLRSLQYQRIDEAMTAVLALRSKAYRFLELMEVRAAKKDVSDAYTDAWSSCNRFEQAYQVARRYSQSQSLPGDRPKEFDELLAQLREPCNSYDPALGISDKEKKDLRGIIDGTINRLATNTVDALRLVKGV
jgi:hypothetical protein